MGAIPTKSNYEWERTPLPRVVESSEEVLDAGLLDTWSGREIWRVQPSTKPPGSPHVPLTPEWFARIAHKRFRRHGRWIPPVMEWDRRKGESVVFMGDGLGSEAVRMAEAGAEVRMVDPDPVRTQLYRRHFAAVGRAAHYLTVPWNQIPLPDARTDVVVAMFHEPPSIPTNDWAREAFRLLRPGGKVIAVLPAFFNAARWQFMLLPWKRWMPRESGWDSLRTTGRELREAFVEFSETTVRKRHLRRSELPYIWRWMMLPVLERVMGRFLVVRAFKPLSAVTAKSRAA